MLSNGLRVPVVMAVVVAAACAEPSDSVSVPQAGRDMDFVVERVSGTVRRISEYRILGQTRAATPSEAVWRFVDKSHESWKEHADSRTAYYVRVENPMTFVSDAIDYYAAQAGRVVTDKKGRMRYTCRLLEFTGPSGPATVRSRRVWATSAVAAVCMCADTAKASWTAAADSSAWYARLAAPVSPGATPRWWEAQAEVEKAGE